MLTLMSYEEFCKRAKRAVNIAQTLGTRSAAGYLRNREIGINSALTLLGFQIKYPHLSLEPTLPRGVLDSQLQMTLVPKG